MAGRRCPTTGCPTILTNGERYCAKHAREYEHRRGTPTQRGYTTQHRALRHAWQVRMDRGETVHCARCGTRINPDSWDLGHTLDRTTWTGPECLPCNRGEAGQRGAAIRNAN